ncbi:AAA family ATPase [Rhizobium sp. 2MFCol3.1]|uniref:AAA family ATPase n=1 Tax=Rhizobium sp. 2MFCol3.1 TaxID=1246459 RepID=UPI0003A7EF6B|nr:AAA family ATPase [Rhizobium sp. 2MFCol3.1]
MISEIDFVQYRKLKKIQIGFEPGMNLISGTNGTCKSTLMHIVSNSFQALKRNDPRFTSSDATVILGKFVDKVNPKIETVSRGDKGSYSNPAEGTSGTLFSVKYVNGDTIAFRRHNSKDQQQVSNFRFSIKPQYARAKKDTLPSVPVVYLGLSRLYPYGELSDAREIDKPRGQLPEAIHAAFVKQYADLTRMEIVQALNQNIADVKKRSDFTTTVQGIDSNTISSGEDNISIILTALNCLRYLTESVVPGQERDVESVLLIDEFDATLHPTAQKKLFDLIASYAKKYRIQVFMTTHSLYILKHAYELKQRIVYLVDQLDRVTMMPDPGPSHIEMHLSGLQASQLYRNVFIPVFTEDEEARFFLEQLLDYISKELDPGFVTARNLLHFVGASIGAKSLRALFCDRKMDQSSMRSICILDGDEKPDLGHHIIALPGGQAPDRMFSAFLRELMENEAYDSFWNEVQHKGFSKLIAEDVLKDFDDIAKKISAEKASDNSTHGMQRELSKKHFKANRDFYDLVIRAWLVDEKSQPTIRKFRSDLYSVFKKTAAYHSIDSRIWPQLASTAKPSAPPSITSEAQVA